MVMISGFLCFIFFCVCDIVWSQSEYHQIHTYPTQHQIIRNNQLQYQYPIQNNNRYVNNFHPITGTNNQYKHNVNYGGIKEAEDRHIHWIKLLKKKKKKKLKLFKKHFKKCGFPFKFKLIKKSDDDIGDLDTVKIQLPQGFGEEDSYFPRANRKTSNTNTTELDDEDEGEDDYEDDDDENQNTTKQYPIVQKPFLRHPSHFMRHMMPKPRPLPPPPLAMRQIPPFRPIKGPIPNFNFPLRSIPRRTLPFIIPRPILPMTNYQINEPIPGLFQGSPPITPKLIPTKSHNQSDDHLKQDKTYKVRYSQPDYSMYGSYQVPSSSTVPSQKSEDENIVTVTPTSVWVVNNPIQRVNSSNNVKSRSINYESSNKNNFWKPSSVLKVSKATSVPFKIIVEDEPEIITSRYSFTSPGLEESAPKIITKENMGMLQEHERYVSYGIAANTNSTYQIVASNNNNNINNRIRRSKIDSLAALVSKSISVKE